MKKIYFLLALCLLGFSATTNLLTMDVTGSAGREYGYLRTDLNFEMNFNTNGNDFCTGQTITITPTYNGIWPKTQGNFEAFGVYRECRVRTDPGRDCPDDPIDYNTINLNQRTQWLSREDFDFIINMPREYLLEQVDLLSGLSSQKVRYRQYENVFYLDKLGGVGVFCDADAEIKITQPNGNQMTLFSGPVASMGSRNFVPNLAGTYTIRTEVRNIRCFGVIEKRPTDDGYYWMNIFRVNLFRYAGSLTETKTVTVQSVSPNMNLIVTAPPENTVFPLDDNNQAFMRVTVRNNGELPVTVNDVMVADPSFDIAPASRSCALVGICEPMLDDGFGDIINAGQTKELLMYAESTLCSPGRQTNLAILFPYSTSQAVCGVVPNPANAIIRYSMLCTGGLCQINSDCPEQEVCWEGECKGFEIDVTPDEANAGPGGEVIDFEAMCTIEGELPVPCSEILDDGEHIEWWYDSNDGATVIIWGDDDGATVTTTNDEGTVQIHAGIRDNEDTATLEISYNGFGLVLEPEEATIFEDETQQYTLTCYNDVLTRNEPVGCGTGNPITWNSNGPITLSGRSSQGITATGNDVGQATIRASKTIVSFVDGRPITRTYSDTATLTIIENPNGYGIDITPDSSQIGLSETQVYVATCYNDIRTKLQPVPCGMTTWTQAPGGLVIFDNPTNEGANVTAIAEGQAEITASTVLRTVVDGVKITTIYTDTSDLTIGPAVKTCTVDKINSTGWTEQYGITCRFGGPIVDCGVVVWSAEGGQIIAQNNDEILLALNPPAGDEESIIVIVTANAEGDVTCSSEEELWSRCIGEDCQRGEEGPEITFDHDELPDKEDDNCIIRGPSVLNAGGTYSYFITCDHPNGCGPVTWNVKDREYFEGIVRIRDFDNKHITLTVKDDEAMKQLIALGNLMTLISGKNQNAGAEFRFYCSVEPKLVPYICTDLT
ncbi:MAG: hypothetical protein ABII22_05665 [Candidatus Micrarchaeota archaeon]